MKTNILLLCIILYSFAAFAQSETTEWWYQLEQENENTPSLSEQGMTTTLKIVNHQRFDWDEYILGRKLHEAIETRALPIFANQSVRTPFFKDDIQKALYKTERDTLVDIDYDTYDEIIRVVENKTPLFPTENTVYQFVQDWDFDKTNQRLVSTFKAINIGHWTMADKYSINEETLKADFTIQNGYCDELSIENNEVTWVKNIYITGTFYDKKLREALLSKAHLLKHKVVNASDYSFTLDESMIAQSLSGGVDTLLDYKPHELNPKVNVIQGKSWTAENLMDFKIVQDIFYDEKNQCFQTKIIAIAPVIPRFDDGGNFMYYESLFYIVYDEVFLRNY